MIKSIVFKNQMTNFYSYLPSNEPKTCASLRTAYFPTTYPSSILVYRETIDQFDGTIEQFEFLSGTLMNCRHSEFIRHSLCRQHFNAIPLLTHHFIFHGSTYIDSPPIFVCVTSKDTRNVYCLTNVRHYHY